MTDSKISFSKEIANTIGLEEAILLEYLKQQKILLNQVSIEQINSDNEFWSEDKIRNILSKLVKTGLVIESNYEGSTHFSSKNPSQEPRAKTENKWHNSSETR